jgi:hypothetical protein
MNHLPKAVVKDAEFLASRMLAKRTGEQPEAKTEAQPSLAEMLAQTAAKNANSKLVRHTEHTASQDESE